MNKEYEKFHRNNASVIENLLESLNVLLDKFENEIVPGEPEKSDMESRAPRRQRKICIPALFMILI